MKTLVAQRDTAAIAQSLFALFALVTTGLIVWQARSALGPYVLGLLFVYLILPIVRKLETLLPGDKLSPKLRRGIAAVVTTFGTIALMMVLLGVLVKPVVKETVDIFENLDVYWMQMQEENESIRDAFEAITPEPVQEWINDNIGKLGHALVDGAVSLVAWLLNAGGSLISTAMAVFAVPLFVVYYMIDEPMTATTLRRHLPRAWAEDIIAVYRIFDRILGTYARGVIIEAVIVGVITGFGYWLIGVELALPLGIIAFAGEIIPILGPWIAFSVSFPVVLATQPELAIAAIGVFLVIQLIEGWVLAPKLQGDSVELTASGTLLLLAIGGAVFGALGIVFALPIAAIIRAAFSYIHYRLKGAGPEAALAEIRPFRAESVEAG